MSFAAKIRKKTESTKLSPWKISNTRADAIKRDYWRLFRKNVMNMKRLLFSLAMLAASLHGFAQHEVGTLTFIPKIGVNLATVTGDDVIYLKDGIGDKVLSPKYRFGVVAGMEGEYQLSKPFSLSVSALYSLQGHQYDDIDFQKNYSTQFHAINVPVMLNFYFLKGLAVKAGVQAGYAFYKKELFDQLIGSSWKSYSTSGATYKEFDISVPVGLSYDIDKLRLDLRYNYGLTSISKLKGMPSVCNRVIQFSVGYALR